MLDVNQWGPSLQLGYFTNTANQWEIGCNTYITAVIISNTPFIIFQPANTTNGVYQLIFNTSSNDGTYLYQVLCFKGGSAQNMLNGGNNIVTSWSSPYVYAVSGNGVNYTVNVSVTRLA